jgi:hypothetical protein
VLSGRPSKKGDIMSTTSMRSARAVVFGMIGLAALALPATAQPMNRCASCHFANLTAVPNANALGDWERSAHARQAVGCEKCHGGDATTYVPGEAHRGVLRAANPSSPVNPSNLVQTCGVCHIANAQAFARTVHQRIVEAGDRRAPTCATCHGTMRAVVLSPAGIEAQCAGCHPVGSARGDYPAAVRAAMEAIDAERRRADEAEGRIAMLPDRTTRVTMLASLSNVRSLLKEGVAALHGFDLRQANDRLDAAHRALAAIEATTAPTAR